MGIVSLLFAVFRVCMRWFGLIGRDPQLGVSIIQLEASVNWFFCVQTRFSKNLLNI